MGFLNSGQTYTNSQGSVSGWWNKNSSGMSTLGNNTPASSIMLNNWLTGGAPKPVDPTEQIAETTHLANSYDAAASGSGYGGAFGKSSGGSNLMSPNAPGAPVMAGALMAGGLPKMPGLPGAK